MNGVIMAVDRSALYSFCNHLPEPFIAKPVASFSPGGGLTLALQYGERRADVTERGQPCKFGSLHALLYELADKENVAKFLAVDTAHYWASLHICPSHTLRRNDPQRFRRINGAHDRPLPGRQEALKSGNVEEGVASVERTDLDQFCSELSATIVAKPIVAFTRGGGMTLWLECGRQRVNVVQDGEPCNFGSLDAVLFELAGKKNIDIHLTVDTAKYWTVSHY